MRIPERAPPNFWADFGEIEYPIVSHDGRRLKVVLKIERIEDADGERLAPLEADDGPEPNTFLPDFYPLGERGDYGEA